MTKEKKTKKFTGKGKPIKNYKVIEPKKDKGRSKQ